MNTNNTWYEIIRLESVDLCGYTKDTSYHPYRSGTSYWVLALIESGQRTLKVDGVPITVKKGDFHILPPGSRHEPLYLDQQSAYYFHFCAQGGISEAPKTVNSEQIILPIDSHVPSEPDCFALARYIYDQSRKPYVGQTFLKNQLQSLLSILSIQTQHSSIFLRGVSPYNDRLLTFIEENMCTSLHSNDFERVFELSYHHLNAVFKQEFGCTLKQYHNRIRMHHAAYLLLSGKSPKEAARLCGFEDYYFFIRCFTKAHGIAPSRYQKKYAIRGTG